MDSILELREKAGKPRSHVAADLKLSERHLYRLEKGVSPLRKMTALAFAEYYGVPVDAIEGWQRQAA